MRSLAVIKGGRDAECINAKMHALSFWRWVGWTCPRKMQPWYCNDVWTNKTLMVYGESSDAWWTAVTWAVLTAVYTVIAGEDCKHRWFYRAFDGSFWVMFFVAPHLPRVYIEGSAGVVAVATVTLAVVGSACYKNLWCVEQWGHVAFMLIIFAVRLGAGNHIHHIEWPWWVLPLTVGVPEGGALAGALMGISAQEMTGAGVV